MPRTSVIRKLVRAKPLLLLSMNVLTVLHNYLHIIFQRSTEYNNSYLCQFLPVHALTDPKYFEVFFIICIPLH